MEVTGHRPARSRDRTENPVADPAGNASPHRLAAAPRRRSETRWFWGTVPLVDRGTSVSPGWTFSMAHKTGPATDGW